MSLNRVVFSSKNYEWETPQKVFDELHEEFNFQLDVCASNNNAKCEKYFTEDQDGLSQRWEGTCWMNPPYGRGIIDKWVKKAYESSKEGATVVCLLPARTCTKWWHGYCEGVPHEDKRFLKGRIKFVGAEQPAPFPSVVVIFRGKK